MVFSNFRSLKNFWVGLFGQRISFFMWQANLALTFSEIHKLNKQRVTFTIPRNGDFFLLWDPFRVTLPKILRPPTMELAPNKVKLNSNKVKLNPKKVKFPTIALNSKAAYAKLISRSKSARPPTRRTNKFHYNGSYRY